MDGFGPPTLPGLKAIRIMGVGAFAEVYEYEQLTPRRRVAVKVFSRPFSLEHEDQFRREVEVLKIVTDHPNINTIFSSGRAVDGRLYIVLELLPGGSLQDILNHRKLSVPEVLQIFIPICGALASLHRAGVAHGDVKPANILFDEFGRPCLSDLGAAQRFGSLEQQLSVPWAAPELLEGTGVQSSRSDLYGLAATIWTALTSRPPLLLPGGDNSPMAMTRRAKSELPPMSREDIPDSLLQALKRGLCSDPRKRISSARELGAELQEVQRELKLLVTPFDVIPVEVLGANAGSERANAQFDVRTIMLLRQSDVLTDTEARSIVDGQRWRRLRSGLRNAVVWVGIGTLAASMATFLMTRPLQGGAIFITLPAVLTAVVGFITGLRRSAPLRRRSNAELSFEGHLSRRIAESQRAYIEGIDQVAGLAAPATPISQTRRRNDAS